MIPRAHRRSVSLRLNRDLNKLFRRGANSTYVNILIHCIGLDAPRAFLASQELDGIERALRSNFFCVVEVAASDREKEDDGGELNER
jgi:hypothetical protein